MHKEMGRLQNELSVKAREYLRKQLARCTEEQQKKFRIIFAKGDMDLPLFTVVSQLPHTVLNNAMTIVDNAVNKRSIRRVEPGNSDKVAEVLLRFMLGSPALDSPVRVIAEHVVCLESELYYSKEAEDGLESE